MSYAQAQYAIDEVKTAMIDKGQSGLPICEMDSFICVPNTKGGFNLNFKISDLIIDNERLSRFNKLTVVWKKDSYPLDIKDGVVAGIFDRSDMTKYVANTFEYSSDQLVTGDKIFVRPFIETDHGVVSSLLTSIKEIIIDKVYVFGFHQDFTNLDPETSITYIEDNVSYLPIRSNIDNEPLSMGSWSTWSWLAKNKPYMLNRDGTIAYALDPNDYTKKVDGTESDILNSSFNGGAFAWFPKLYIKEVYASDGNSRDVYFTDKKEYAEVNGFVDIFKSINPTATGETKIHAVDVDSPGYWVAMFYTNSVGTSSWNLSGRTIAHYSTVESDVKDNKEISSPLSYFSSLALYRLGFFGGDFCRLIRDLLYMLYKSTNISYHAGYGFKITQGQYQNTLLENCEIDFTHGGFYGRSITNKAFCKVFHTFTIATGCVPLSGATDKFYAINMYYSDGRGKARLNAKKSIFYNGEANSTTAPLYLGPDTVDRPIVYEGGSYNSAQAVSMYSPQRLSKNDVLNISFLPLLKEQSTSNTGLCIIIDPTKAYYQQGSSSAATTLYPNLPNSYSPDTNSTQKDSTITQTSAYSAIGSYCSVGHGYMSSSRPNSFYTHGSCIIIAADKDFILPEW